MACSKNKTYCGSRSLHGRVYLAVGIKLIGYKRLMTGLMENLGRTGGGVTHKICSLLLVCVLFTFDLVGFEGLPVLVKFSLLVLQVCCSHRQRSG